MFLAYHENEVAPWWNLHDEGFIDEGFINEGFINEGFIRSDEGFINEGFIDEGFINEGFIRLMKVSGSSSNLVEHPPDPVHPLTRKACFPKVFSCLR